MSVACNYGKEMDAQFEESVGYLKHEDVRVIVFVADQYSLTRPPHAMLLVMFL